MILAAGLGTRLGPLTAAMPKALVRVGGVPVIELVARRLIDAGVDRLIINTHHFRDQIVDYVRSRSDFGVEVVFSHEEERPLETGGGLKAAARLIRRDAPFYLHNADILSSIPLPEMYNAHQTSGALATLAVLERESTRQLLFDDDGLFGRTDTGKDLRIETRARRGRVLERGFCGIHIVSPGLLDLITEDGAFPIFDSYLRLAGAGYRIARFDAEGSMWIDIGKPQQLAEADRIFSAGRDEQIPGFGSGGG